MRVKRDKKFYALILTVFTGMVFAVFAILLLLLLSAGCGSRDIERIEISELAGGKSYNGDGSAVVPKGCVLFEVHGKDGDIIIENACVKYKANLSVADLSKAVCRELNIPFALSGAGMMMYVQGINNLFEFDYGSESGWLYSVGGEFQNVSCGSYTVKDGDYVEWYYTLDFGKDVGAYKLD